MPAVYEGAVQDLIDEFGELPGIGPKSAQRMAFHVLAAAMAAARAAAQEADTDSLADDTPSEDDPDAEDAGVVGLEVVKRILGAQVIEEVTVTQEGR